MPKENKKNLKDICKDLTEEHIIKACEKYKKELQQFNGQDKKYILYNFKKYQFKKTIRYANDEILNNQIKLKKNKPDFTSGQYESFFNENFSSSKHLKLKRFEEKHFKK